MYNFQSPVINKSNNFHLLRLVCCLIVIYEHFCVLTNNSLLCLNLRGEAVNVFIISGFWITISLLNSSNIFEYAKKRFVRIFPSYWIVVISFSIILFFFSIYDFHNYFGSRQFWKYILANIFTLNFLCPSLPGVFDNMGANGAVNGSLWTIKVEIGFYLILPLFIYVFERCKTKVKIILVACLYILSALFPVFITAFNLPSSLSNQLPAYFGYFLGGIIFALYFDKLNKKLFFFAFPSLVIFILGIVFNFYFLEPIVLSVLVFYFSFNIPSIVDIKKDYSYYMYLIHFPIIQMMNFLHIFDSAHYMFMLFLIISTTFLGSIILEKLVSLLNSLKRLNSK